MNVEESKTDFGCLLNQTLEYLENCRLRREEGVSPSVAVKHINSIKRVVKHPSFELWATTLAVSVDKDMLVAIAERVAESPSQYENIKKALAKAVSRRECTQTCGDILFSEAVVNTLDLLDSGECPLSLATLTAYKTSIRKLQSSMYGTRWESLLLKDIA
ncbi:MAG: hypothetical protein Q9M44_05655, partial [Ghiorsea sp.]|nr:hypothetical protein [Ghiorsea sp.]